MGISGIVVRYVVIGCALLLSACGGGGGGGDSGSRTANTPAPPPPTSGIGPAGGTVDGPNGAKVVIPPGALAIDTTIAIALTSAGAPLPTGFTPLGADVRLHAARHHVRRAGDDDAAVRSGVGARRYDAAVHQDERAESVGAGRQRHVRRRHGTAQVRAFSDATVVIPALSRNEPTREWEFLGFRQWPAWHELSVARRQRRRRPAGCWKS